MGYESIRFGNLDVAENIEMVLAGIYDACMARIGKGKKQVMAKIMQEACQMSLPKPLVIEDHRSSKIHVYSREDRLDTQHLNQSVHFLV